MESRNRSGRLPVGVLAELNAVLGAEHVLTTPEALDQYSRCTIPWRTECAVVVFPASTEEVAATMRIAARHGIPVWPSSKGRNWGYATTLACTDGAMVMILERMNRILEVNEELAYAVIEPGVTYEQFNAHLAEHGHKLWIDCIDGTAQGSVIGNAIERGVGETPYGDHFGNLCGLEVVLADGEVVRTGSTREGLHTWHTHKWGVGPYLEGLFTQSNLGVVTRAGIWLMPAPECHESFVFQVSDESHMPAVVDAYRKLALGGVVTTKMHLINDFVSLTILTQRIAEPVPQGGALTDADLGMLRSKYGVAPWSCAGAIYGTRSLVREQRRLIRKALAPYGRLIFVADWQIPWIERIVRWAWKSEALRGMTQRLAGTSLPVLESAPFVHKIQRGVPTEYFVKHAYYRARRPPPVGAVHPARDNCGLIWFAPILPFTNAHLWPYVSDTKALFAAHGFDYYVAMLLMNPRSMICLMAIIYDREDPDEVERSRQLYAALLDHMCKRCYEQYRAGLAAWDTLHDDAPELKRLNDRIKAALDPANILAPGHYGVGTSEREARHPTTPDTGGQA
ncbi:MAG TPA: FAD-binding oxidoreductase [Thauera sp.]|jgi:4-cresol dehydrogenase (hydroxylating)|uniref:FAD-binding oxidoreductase n=1 Tax=Thauera sp. TaxID=1905334 RepID=UPI000FB2E753|nr:FAD-binding oxidoreductase [Thauera sp.]MCP5224122.1 FAD-binding oxidoreductase [Thauera sp.]RTL17352.1 MAG: FAD-binding oxidoreductase [Rhodocyclaceae bacterium]HRV77130.1 FAD-binding oxidoreductase [Thauera sp.]